MNMLRNLRGLAFVAALFAPAAAIAQSSVLDQIPAPAPSASNTNQNSELYLQSYAVSGGTLYSHILKQGGQGGPLIGVADTFVPTGSGGGIARYFHLTDALTDSGVGLSTAPSAGAFGVSRTAGTSLVLTGEATSSSAKTDKALFETNIPTTYQANANIPVTVNANYATTGTVTAASTTISVAAYTEINGVEAALTVSAAQQFTATAANYIFTITGTGLVPGEHISIEVVMLVTTSAGAATGQINSIAPTY
jgi:hypothetical protein